MNEEIKEKAVILPPFKHMIMTIGELPSSYVETMTYYEMLVWFTNYLGNTVIPAINENGEAVIELQELFVNLQTYVNDYFDNLDVQEEINNKLDEMVKTGEIQELLSLQYQELENEVNEQLNNIEETFNDQMSVLTNALNDKIDEQDTKIDNAVSGSPLVASSTSGMTDTSRVYVNTTDGKWYYYDGDSWEIGGTYQGTTVSSSDPVITELDARLNQYMNYYYFNETATFNSPFSVKSGQKVFFHITAVTVTTNIYTVDHASSIYKILTSGSTGDFEITTTSDGALRFYLTGAGNIQGYCYIENKVMNLIENNEILKENYIPNVTSFDEVQLKRKRIYSNFTNLTNHAYNFNSSATIKTVDNYSTTSSVSLPTPVIRVRDNLGNLIYNNLNFADPSKVTASNTATAIWTFDQNGKYLRTLNFTNLKARNPFIATDEYYVILNSYPTVAGYEEIDWSIDNINIDWINNEESNTYYVGTGKDFDTFTEMLEALQDDSSEKTIYVDPGEYNIFEEMGGSDYMASLVETASTTNWRTVNYVVPDNTKIIGIGNVVLKWEATAAEMYSQDVAFLFSPLNVSGNCYIENINVIAENCRYALHDETSGLSKFNGAKHEFKNCTFTFKNSTYGIFFPYGAGHNKEMTIKFDNCRFTSYGQIIWSTHDWPTGANENSIFEFNNCIFDRIDNTQTNGYIRFLSSDTVGRKDLVKFNNCYINGNISLTTAENSDVRQGYDLTLIGCTEITPSYNEHVTTRYDVKQYNSYQ